EFFCAAGIVPVYQPPRKLPLSPITLYQSNDRGLEDRGAAKQAEWPRPYVAGTDSMQGWLRRRKPGRPSSSSAAPYWLLEFAEVEGRRVGKLLLCQIGCKLCLAADLDLVDRHGNQLFARTRGLPP